MEEITHSRRGILKRIATSGAIVTGIGTAIGSASAQSSDNNPSYDEQQSNVGTLAPSGVKTDCVSWNDSRDVYNIDIGCTGRWNVHTNAHRYADHALNVALDDCRSKADVVAEIEAHLADWDGGIHLSCDGWGIDSTDESLDRGEIDRQIEEVKTRDSKYSLSNLSRYGESTDAG